MIENAVFVICLLLLIVVSKQQKSLQNLMYRKNRNMLWKHMYRQSQQSQLPTQHTHTHTTVISDSAFQHWHLWDTTAIKAVKMIAQIGFPIQFARGNKGPN